MVSDDALAVLAVTLGLATLHYLVPPTWVGRSMRRAMTDAVERAREWWSSEDAARRRESFVAIARGEISAEARMILMGVAREATEEALGRIRAEAGGAEGRLRELAAAAVADGLSGVLSELREETSRVVATPQGQSALAAGGLDALAPLLPARYRGLLRFAPLVLAGLGAVEGGSGSGSAPGRGRAP